jgi:hypothetical protein
MTDCPHDEVDYDLKSRNVWCADCNKSLFQVPEILASAILQAKSAESFERWMSPFSDESSVE